MVIERWTGPPVETHSYLVIEEHTREAWAIDAPLETAEPRRKPSSTIRRAWPWMRQEISTSPILATIEFAV